MDLIEGGTGKNNSKSEKAQKAYQLGYAYEGNYGACSQCTILAIMDALGSRNHDIFKASFGFAGGIGSLSKTCGAFLAGVMMISFEHGRELEKISTQTEEEKLDCHQMVRDLHDRIIDAYGSIECAEVHQKLFGRTFNQWDEAEFEEFLRLGGHEDKCTKVVGNVAKWTVELLSNSDSDDLPG